MIDFLLEHGFKKISDTYRLELDDGSSIEILSFSEVYWIVRFEEVSQDNVTVDYNFVEKSVDKDNDTEWELQCDIIVFIEHHSN